MKHHRRAVYDALRVGYFGLLPEEARERIGDLPSELQQMILINANGWVLVASELWHPSQAPHGRMVAPHMGGGTIGFWEPGSLGRDRDPIGLHG